MAAEEVANEAADLAATAALRAEVIRDGAQAQEAADDAERDSEAEADHGDGEGDAEVDQDQDVGHDPQDLAPEDQPWQEESAWQAATDLQENSQWIVKDFVTDRRAGGFDAQHDTGNRPYVVMECINSSEPLLMLVPVGGNPWK